MMQTNIVINESRPRVGIGVMIWKNGKILLGKRRGSHGEGEYAFPGGHLEWMERFETCIEREIAEECGLHIANIRFEFVANVFKYHPKHYVHLGFAADWQLGEPEVREPDKVESWDWYSPYDLPEPMFYMCTLAFDARLNGWICKDVQ